VIRRALIYLNVAVLFFSDSRRLATSNRRTDALARGFDFKHGFRISAVYTIGLKRSVC